MANELTYQITIEGTGLSIKQDVTKTIGDQIVVLVLTGRTPTSEKTSPQTQPGPVMEPTPAPQHVAKLDEPGMSLREFLNESTPPRIIDKITAIGCYKKIHEIVNEFDSSSLISAFQAAAEPAPKNLPRDLRSAVKAGWIAEITDKKGFYYVTSTGQKVVENKFPKGEIKKAKSDHSRNNSRTRAGEGA